jgi:5-methyltetrahydrofolate--homocysteine methyltransferase
MSILDEINQSVIDGEFQGIEGKVRQALDEGHSAEAILNQALIPAMTEVGARFERQEYYVPEMLVAARTMQSGLGVIRPLLADSGVEPIGKVMLGTVTGDLHDIGKNLVGMMLEGAGFEVGDLGVDIPPEKFVEAARGDVDIIGMSALLTTTMGYMRAVVDALVEAGVRDRVKVIIGGAPVTQAFAAEIGADGYASDASSAATLAKSLIQS